MILLDTNIISELMRPAPDAMVRHWLEALGDEPLAVSVITISEIVFGLERLENDRRKQDLQARFEAFVAPDSGLTIFPLDEDSARLAGAFRALRVSSGQHGHASDMFIAGIVGANGTSLATRNTKDFSELPIELLDPWEA